MKRWLISGLVVLLFVGGGGYLAVQRGLIPMGAPPNLVDSSVSGGMPASAPASVAAPPRVMADARLVPAQRADVSLAVGGIVTEILVREGDQVLAGQLLVRLNDSQQKVAVVRAQADLDRAQAQLQELLAPPRPEAIAQAEAALNAAQARYAQLAGAALPGNIAAAEAAVNVSQAGLAKVLEGASEQQLIAARADLANAEAILKQAQSAYNLVKWRNDLGATPQSAALQQATNTYEAAKARLADLERGASQADVAGANAQVRQAQAQLQTLRNAMPAEVTAAQADVNAQQAQLDLLLAGARRETIAVAEAQVAASTAALQAALVTLGETELRAPFAGTVAALNIAVGEQAAAGAALLQLADLTTWEIETEDLTELDVVGIAPGREVALTFDAIPDLALSGVVKRIRPIGEDNRGDIVYTVVIDPAQQDPRFLWNMTTVVILQKPS
ncbi:MAG: HlyD family efflux transporter periplasmic adaptor subunit [Caldilineaceae bacterium]|nr:HlyD family efflux transporter periplasmic adaptor subunit [Caldilineaceae bacterium]